MSLGIFIWFLVCAVLIAIQGRKVYYTSIESMRGMLHKFLIWDSETDRQSKDETITKDSVFVAKALVIMFLYGILCGSIIFGVLLGFTS